MNPTLGKFARQTLKEGLAQCNEAQQHMFKRFYSHKNLDLDINTVVDQMPDDKLDWSMQQVERTLQKNTAKLNESEAKP